MKATLRNKCNGSDAPSCRSSRTFARIHTFPLPFTNTNTDFADRITGLVIRDGFDIYVTKCFALYMAEMAFNVHLPRADLDLRFVCSTLEPLIDFKFEVASSFLFVSTKYRQEILLKTLRFMVCCVFMIPTGEFGNSFFHGCRGFVVELID